MVGIYKIQSKKEPRKFLIIRGDEMVLNSILVPLNAGQYPGERLQDHFNKYGAGDLVCSLLYPCSNFLSVKKEKHYVSKMNPYFNGADPIVTLDEVPEVETTTVMETVTEKAVIKEPKKATKKRTTKKK